jgi:hypothetical protein
VRVAGLGYVLAWLVGLGVTPGRPDGNASSSELYTYLGEHGGAFLIQELLVHGAAGLFLLLLTVTVYVSRLVGGQWRPAVAALGLGASLASLAQAAMAVRALHGIASNEPGDATRWVGAIDATDAIKLILLAGLVLALTHATKQFQARWLRGVAWLLAPLLAVGAGGFAVTNPVSMAALEGSLALLLLWVGAASWRLGRRIAWDESWARPAGARATCWWCALGYLVPDGSAGNAGGP